MRNLAPEFDWVHYVIWNDSGVPRSVDLLAVKKVMAHNGITFGESGILEKNAGLIPYIEDNKSSGDSLQTMEFRSLLDECYDPGSVKWVTRDAIGLAELIGNFNDIGTTWFVDREGGRGDLDDVLKQQGVELEPHDDMSQGYMKNLATLLPTNAAAAYVVPQTGLTTTITTGSKPRL